MRKLFLSLAAFVMAFCANAQTNQYFWYQGNLMLGIQIAQIDSVTFGDSESVDTLHLLLPRTIIKTVEVHDTIYITIHDTVCPNDVPEGALAGEFSVSATKKVRFSKGNLQYVGTWQFAEHQWEYFGASQFDDHRDGFGWGTGDAPNKSSMEYNDYSTFTDWGTNAITNGGNKANLWRTLTKDEWNYVFHTRSNAAALWGMGTVNGVNGTILLPDNFILPEEASFTASAPFGSIDSGGTYYNSNGDNYSHNTYTLTQWAIMESAGAIFLAAPGGVDGAYWSSTPHADWCSFSIQFRPERLFTQNWNDSDLFFKFCVRLVQDVEK